MKAILTMSGTLVAVVRGQVTIAELENPEVHFFFGCTQHHFFQVDGLYPFEAAWANEKKGKRPDYVNSEFGGSGIFESAIDDENVPKIKQFIATVRIAEQAGRVQWKCITGAVLRAQNPDTLCFFNGVWKTAKEWIG